ncbi:MAG TPA: GTPase, partial [Blastocatellia bacterium]|nr:GTPase [Blastocatellia bacterium]
STNRAPRYHQDGEAGETRRLDLELKLIADVGLVGFPNAGKSTLISRISSARPKVADYPFTTLEPHLGVVGFDDYRSFVVADIPGLIEGAHAGAGLGLEFLRHVERTKILLQMIDISSASGRDPVEDYKTIAGELEAYSMELSRKPRMVAASKMDALDDESRLIKLREFCKAEGMELAEISSVTGQGISQLIASLASHLDALASESEAGQAIAADQR